MDFSFDDDQQMIRDTARRFAEAQVAPVAHELDEAEAFAEAGVAGLAELGLMGMFCDPELGGSGLDLLTGALAIEEIARHDASLAMVMVAHNGQATLQVDRWGPAELRQQWLPLLSQGQTLGTWADAAEGACAAQEGEAWTVSGKLPFVPLGTRAGLLVVRADTAEGPATFAVPLEQQGVVRIPASGRLGLRAADLARIELDGAQGTRLHAPTDDGHEHRVVSHVLLAAISVGIARGALEHARAYSLERKQFKKPLAQFQAIQWKIADTATETDAARLMAHRAAALHTAGQPALAASAQARLLAADVAVRAAYEAIQIYGGNGFVREFPLERFSRDAKVLQSGFGAADVMRRAVSRLQLAG